MNQQQLLQLRAQLKIAAQLNTCTTTNTREIDNSSGITSTSPLESIFQSNPMHTMAFWKGCPEAPHHHFIKCPVGDFDHHQLPMALLAQERDNYIQMKMQTHLRRLSAAYKSAKLSKEDQEKYNFIQHMLYLNSRQKYERDNFYNSYAAYSSGNPLKKKDISAIVRMKPLSQQEKKKKYVIRGISYNDFLWATGSEFKPETPFTPLPRYVIRNRQKDNPHIDLKQTLPVVKSVLSASASLFVANHAYDFFTVMRTNYQKAHTISQELNKRLIEEEKQHQQELLSDLQSKINSLADESDDSFHKFWKPPTFTHGIRIYPQPSNLDPSVVMHKYQIEGMSWLVHLYDHHLNAILADQTGLGKTLEIISFLAFLNEQRHISGPHLIVMPNSVLETWDNEFKKHYPEAVTVLYTFKKKRRHNIFEKTISRGDFDILITSYMILVKDIEYLKTISWRVVVLDEAHMLKNQKTEVFATVDKLYSDFRILSTATPFQNDIKEFWAILYLISAHEFCSLEIFKAFFKELESNNPDDQQRERILNRLQEIIHPYILRRKKNDIDFNMTDKFEVTFKNSPSELQKRIIQRTLDFNLSTSQKIFISRKVSNSPVLFLEKKHFKSVPANYILSRSPKLRVLDQILTKLIYTDHKFLIYSQWTSTMDVISNVLQFRQIIFSRIDGSVPVRERMRIIKEFVQPGSNVQGMLLSTRSSAFGLNLQVADTVILFDSDYNPFVELQASDRVHRLGQKNIVVIIRLMMNGTGEEKILRVSRRKFILGHQIIDTGKFNFNSDGNDKDTIEVNDTSIAPDIDDPKDEQLDGIVARSQDELMVLQYSNKQPAPPESPEFSKIDDEIMERINKQKFDFQSSESEYEEWEDVEFD